MKIEVSAKVSGPDLAKPAWTADDMKALCEWARFTVDERVTVRHLDAAGKHLRPYSTRPIWIGKTSETARRLKPKGGVNAGGSIHYPGGYRQYKQDSTGSAEVNLTLSGQGWRAFRVKTATATLGVVGFSGQPAVYMAANDESREFLGLSPDELKEADLVIAGILEARLRGKG